METVRVCTAAASYAGALSCACGACGLAIFAFLRFSASPFRFQIREFRFNHVTRCVATELLCGMRERCKIACEARYTIVTKEGWFASRAFDCSSDHCQCQSERCQSCRIHLRERTNGISWPQNQIARDVAGCTRVNNKVRIGEKCRAGFARSLTSSDQGKVSGFPVMARLAPSSCLASRCRSFQKRVDRLLAAEKFFNRPVHVA